MKQTPGRAIRQFCVTCCGEDVRGAKSCDGNPADKKLLPDQACILWPHRTGRGRPKVKTIRKFCLDCMGGSQMFVRECDLTDCPLHLFRMGKNPNFIGRPGFGSKVGGELV